jgi:tetratricopeptide (TPR) repeat protein
MTALARDPRERYKTVRALADDVECFLADEPVSCYRDPVFERVRRWSRKRRTLVTSMAGVLLAVAVASGVAWVRESSLNRRLVKLNQDLKLEERKSHERELLAIDSVKKFRDVVSKNRILRSRADLKDLRDTLLREPLAFFEKLRLQLESAPNPSAANQGRLADALYELARSTWNLSRLSDSEVSMARCVQIRQRLAANTVASRRQQFTLAEALHDHAEILHDLGRYNEAQSRFESAVRVLEPLHESDPSDTEAIDLLAWHTSGLAFF